MNESGATERAGRHPLANFLGAAQFLTRIPIHLTRPPRQANCVPWFPIVGACIGVAVGAVAAGMMELVPPSVAAAVAVLVAREEPPENRSHAEQRQDGGRDV